MNNKKGISLIVLVITILVMIILAGVVIVSLQNDNPIDKAKTAKLQDSVASIRAAISQYAVTKQAESTDTLENTMGSLLTGNAVTVSTNNEYNGYKKLNYSATDIKKALGVDPSSLAASGDFYVDPQTGASVFRLKADGTESEGIVNPGKITEP